MKFKADGPLFTALTRIFDCLLLNILWIICSLPIVTMGAATSALYYVMLKIVRKDDSSITKLFFEAFRQNIKKGSVMTLIFGVSGALLGFDLLLFKLMGPANGEVFQAVIEAALIILLVIWGMALSYSFPLLAQFENPVNQTIKNALRLAIANLKKTVIILGLNSVFPIAVFVLPEFLFWVLPVYTMIGFSLTAFLNTKLLVKIFDAYIDPVPKMEN